MGSVAKVVKKATKVIKKPLSKITKGIARYSGSNTSTEWSNFDEIDEAISKAEYHFGNGMDTYGWTDDGKSITGFYVLTETKKLLYTTKGELLSIEDRVEEKAAA